MRAGDEGRLHEREASAASGFGLGLEVWVRAGDEGNERLGSRNDLTNGYSAAAPGRKSASHGPMQPAVLLRIRYWPPPMGCEDAERGAAALSAPRELGSSRARITNIYGVKYLITATLGGQQEQEAAAKHTFDNSGASSQSCHGRRSYCTV